MVYQTALILTMIFMKNVPYASFILVFIELLYISVLFQFRPYILNSQNICLIFNVIVTLAWTCFYSCFQFISISDYNMMVIIYCFFGLTLSVPLLSFVRTYNHKKNNHVF